MTERPLRPQPELATPGPVVTTLAPTPAPQSPREAVLAVLEREGLAAEWPAWDCIIQAESRWNPNAIGAAQERGLTQVHPIHWDRVRYPSTAWADGSRLFDPEYNMEVALVLWRASGWQPWTTRWKCGLR